MKKIIKIFISILVLTFVIIYIMVWIDKYNTNELKELIKNNTKITNINYINKYNLYYLITDDKYLYILKDNYEQINKTELNKIHNNHKNYEIIYQNDNAMYMNNYVNNDTIVFVYYDLYTYEKINEINLGGNNG